jgi:hypothetical protein
VEGERVWEDVEREREVLDEGKSKEREEGLDREAEDRED